MGFRSSCVEGAHKPLVLQYGEGASLAKAPVNAKVKRKPEKHTFIIMLYSSPSISPPPRHDCKDRSPLGIVDQYDPHFYIEKANHLQENTTTFLRWFNSGRRTAVTSCKSPG